MKKRPHIVVMGVCGCGKSTVGRLLASKFEVPFYDGDDYHPQANVDKMRSGTPLNDNDRQPWLKTLASLFTKDPNGCVIACSALKEKYRNILRSSTDITIVFLEGSEEMLRERLDVRTIETDHFMPSSLLISQLEILEDPRLEPDVLAVNIANSPEQIAVIVLQHFKHVS